jgi:hypothetical protein
MFGTSSSGQYAILLAMLAPALFMTATGSLLQSGNNRLARVVDRMRTLMRECESADTAPERRAFLRQHVARQRIRCQLILTACRLLYLALAAFVGSSLAVAADSALDNMLVHLPTALAVAGVSLVLAACLFLYREAAMAVHALNRELDRFSGGS